MPGRDRAAAEARAADRLGPAADPRDGAGGPLVETVWLEPYPTRGSGRGRVRLARRPLRAARERRAGVHRRAPAPAGQPARGADPARGARLLRQGGRRDARHDAGVGEQRPAARPRRPSTSGCPSRASRRRCARSATRGSASWSSVRRRVGAGDVDAVVAMLAEDATFSMPPNCDGFAAAGRSAEFLPAGPLGDPARFIPTRANGQLAFGTYRLIDGAWAPAQRDPRDHARRSPDRRDHRVRHAGGHPPLLAAELGGDLRDAGAARLRRFRGEERSCRSEMGTRPESPAGSTAPPRSRRRRRLLRRPARLGSRGPDAPGGPGHYFMARLRGRVVAAIGRFRRERLPRRCGRPTSGSTTPTRRQRG